MFDHLGELEHVSRAVALARHVDADVRVIDLGRQHEPARRARLRLGPDLAGGARRRGRLRHDEASGRGDDEEGEQDLHDSQDAESARETAAALA